MRRQLGASLALTYFQSLIIDDPLNSLWVDTGASITLQIP